MMDIDKKILVIDEVISKNIDRFDDSERGLLSQNILSQLRNFIEHTALKACNNDQDIEIVYSDIPKALNYVRSRGDLKFLAKFHKFLQPIASHYTMDEENSERLMLKYYEYLLRIKSYLSKTHNLDVLKNIEQFPIDLDSATKEYYEKIAQKINSVKPKNQRNDRYYIQKIKPFFVSHEVYYEVTFTRSSDNVSKFDRVIAFTKLDISPIYAVKLYINDDSIDVLDKKMPIHIITDWEVSIRPCELDNFAKILGIFSTKHNSNNHEYQNLMKFLKNTGFSLVDLMDIEDKHYEYIKSKLTDGAKTTSFSQVLDKCRELVKSRSDGSNVIRYLLYKLNNKIIKQQYQYKETCNGLSNLYLGWGCKVFDEMPFNASLLGHNPRLCDLFDCIDYTGREHELFARLIKNNTETKGELYTHKGDIKGFKDIDGLINLYNKKLYKTHKEKRSIANYKDFIYVAGYEADTIQIIQKIKELSASGVKGYTNSVEAWMQSTSHAIDCADKKTSLQLMFEKSKVALIYGSAGTGKSTMINHISQFFNDKRKLYLANTNPAIDNLKRKVAASNCEFKTIAKFLYGKSCETDFDLLFIDECSTVNNSDMLDVLNKASFNLLVLVGDVFQIESINFGNWFNALQSFIPKNSTTELITPYRTKNSKLLELWNKVRNIDDNILEHIAKNDYSKTLDDSIFVRSENDEIILLLNYDGLYGINNINRFLQENNENKSIIWENLTYKVSDPILFNETKRFGPSIFNNLKGKIVDFRTFEDKIQFDIEIDKSIMEMDTFQYDYILLGNQTNSNSIIQFNVTKHRSTDDDDESSAAVVPFQIAYAVSIHKAQGLEYDSVKVVITNEVEERISHNVFYTAITRAKEKLKIYWSPETESKILTSLKKRNINRDVGLIRSKIEVK
ncbi:MAG: helicase [Proteobacteria bacterium]|nr:MAG: helicase [Pseudomonadota bacterium]